MPEKRAAPRQSVVSALIKPLIAAGCTIKGVRYYEDSSIEVLTGNPAGHSSTASAYDQWNAEQNARSA